jgi:hypothetical protein
MKKQIQMVMMVLSAAVAGTACAGEPLVSDSDWCSVTTPSVAQVGQPVEVQIDFKDIPSGMKVRADLHWRKTDGTYSGINKWGGVARDAAPNSTVVFSIAPKDKPGLGAVMPYIFISPTGEHADRVKETTATEIPVASANVAKEAEGTVVAESDWCIISSPAQSLADEQVVVTVRLKQIDPGQLVHVDFHWYKADGSYGGFNKWGGDSQPATSGQTLTFKGRPPMKPGLDTVRAHVHLSPTGDYKDRTKDARGAAIKLLP